jgi:hypothetical protein
VGRDQTCQAIESIREIDGIRFADDDEGCNGDVPQPQFDIAMSPWQTHFGRTQQVFQHKRSPDRQDNLCKKFCAGPHPFATPFAANPFPIIQSPQRGVSDQDDERYEHRAADHFQTDEHRRIQLNPLRAGQAQ